MDSTTSTYHADTSLNERPQDKKISGDLAGYQSVEHILKDSLNEEHYNEVKENILNFPFAFYSDLHFLLVFY